MVVLVRSLQSAVRPGDLSMLLQLVLALEVVLFLTARVSRSQSEAPPRPSLSGAFADYSLLTHTTTVHRVLKLPRCPACGTEAWGHPTIRAWMEPSDRR